MAYVAIGILFLLVVGAGIMLFVMANAKSSAPASADDHTSKAGAPFAGRDDTPVGDTAEHAGDQDLEGHTVAGVYAPARGQDPGRGADDPAGGRFKRDPIGGEAEAEPTIDAGDAPRPQRG